MPILYMGKLRLEEVKKLTQSQGLFNSKASFHKLGPNGQHGLGLGISGNLMW